LAITREKKSELLEEYKVEIGKSSALIFTNFRGTSVAQLRSLRRKLSDTGTSYMVVKNSLFGLALEQLGRTKPDALLAGPNGVAFITEDIGKSVTALNDWIKAEKVLEVTGALVENSVVNAAGAEALADLPTKEQMLAAVLGTINAPAGNLARILNAPSASLARVINARVEKLQEAAA
jgi:large subunit ribosomal protein L10